MGHPGPPTQIAKNVHLFTLGPIHEKLVAIFPFYRFVRYVMRSYCPEILDLNLKSSFQIASLFHMYIDMGEMIAGDQDRPCLIIECSPGHLK